MAAAAGVRAQSGRGATTTADQHVRGAARARIVRCIRSDGPREHCAARLARVARGARREGRLVARVIVLRWRAPLMGVRNSTPGR